MSQMLGQDMKTATFLAPSRQVCIAAIAAFDARDSTVLSYLVLKARQGLLRAGQCVLCKEIFRLCLHIPVHADAGYMRKRFSV